MEHLIGMRNIDRDFSAKRHPGSWDEMIRMFWPDGDVSLTALLDLLPSEKVSDYWYHWFTERWEWPGGTTVVYTDQSLGTPYTVGSGVVGTILFAKVSAHVAGFFRPGQMALLRTTNNSVNDLEGEVLQANKNGANSYVTLRLSQADSSTIARDVIQLAGNYNPQGGERPEALSTEPDELYSYTQIFRDPLELSRTEMQTRFRGGFEYERRKNQLLKRHAQAREFAYLFGRRFRGTGSNNLVVTRTMGLREAISTYFPSNIFTYNTDPDYSGQTWLEGGKSWLDNAFEMLFGWNGTAKLAYCGAGVLTAINQLAEAYGSIQLRPKEYSFGLNVHEWVTPHGSLDLKVHPLFSQSLVDKYSMLVFRPAEITRMVLQPTIYKNDPNRGNSAAGASRIDGIAEEFLTEDGLKFRDLSDAGWLSGFGFANTA